MISRRSAASFWLAFVCAASALCTAPRARAQSPTPQGEIVASLKFDPKVHGFGFRNFGENPEYDEDLTADDMIRMFGAENVCIDPDKGMIYFEDDDGDEDKYDVRVSRTSPNGKEEVFEEFDLDIGDDNSYALNFGAWDGKGKMCFKDDDDSYEDEECEEVEDEEPSAKP